MQEVNSIAPKTEFDRIWALFEETRRQIKETDRVLSEKFKETAERFKETDRILSEKFKETQKLVGRLSNSWGEFVEGLVIPSVIRMFAERDIEIERVGPRVKSHKGGETMEIDIIGDNSSYVVVVEVKSKLLSGDVINFIEKLGNFKYFFPNYADKKVVGAVAGISVDESVKNFAEKKGFFVIMQKGESVEIVNYHNFTPKVW
jgi:hypothetical protein